ncbi:MAG: hypothetical protein DSZ03_09120 [Sulfurimonas sp.]|nr:MAG: hypothetical protein DSZ03_09120 [Sulfurimonas sp.]
MRKIYGCLLAVMTLWMSGCTATIGNLQEYEAAPMSEAEFMPSAQEMNDVNTKVLFIRLNNGGSDTAQRANLAQTLNTALISALASGGGIELIDRAMDVTLSDEIKLHELHRDTPAAENSVRLASYALKGEISSATFATRYVKARVWYDKKGKLHRSQPYYVYTSRVEGILGIYAVPSMRLLKNFDFYGSSSHSKASRYAQRFNAALVQQAGRSAIGRVRQQLQHFLSPKGYVLYKRIRDDEAIYEVSLGHNEGLSMGDDVNLYRKYRFHNPITDKSEIREKVIAAGSVSEKIDAHSAWIILQSIEAGYEVRLGDVIRKTYDNW